MKKSLAALVFLSSFVTVPVWAATSTSAVAPTAFSFSGPYAGLDLGFSAFTNHIETGGTTLDQGTTGLAYGAYAGYGMQFQGPWYIGGELGLGNTTGSAKLGGASVTAKESQNYTFNADLRGGKVLGQSTLAYVKLGWAHTDMDQTVNTASDNASFDGLRFGAGAETLLSDNLTGHLEAIYTDYNSQTINGAKFAPSDVGVRFGVSYYLY